MTASYASTMLAQFDTNITLVTSESVNVSGGGFKASGYRFTPDKEPDSATNGLYYLDLSSTTPKMRAFGTGENFWNAQLTVQIGFYRGGGDMGGGSRRQVLDTANDDCMKVGDVCENPLNYNSTVSGIRSVRYTGHRRSFDLKSYEVWEVSFDVEWRSDVITS